MSVPVVCEYCQNKNHRDDIKCTECCGSLDAYFVAIKEALAALLKWLDEACDKHPYEISLAYQPDLAYPEHRKDCPKCWQERKRSVGL